MRIWDLCCGTGSVGRPWKRSGHEVLSLDMNPKSGASIICDMLEWDYTNFSLADPDVIFCSPPCTHYSIARSKAKTPRDLEGADAILQRCLDIIAYWKPKVWFIENPQTGLLKSRLVVQGLPYVDVDYCMYGRPFKKRTRIWTNAKWFPRPPCNHKIHPKTIQKGPSKRQHQLIEGDNVSLDELQ